MGFMDFIDRIGETVSDLPNIGNTFFGTSSLDIADKIAANTDPTQLTAAAFGVSEEDRINYAHLAGLIAAAYAGAAGAGAGEAGAGDVGAGISSAEAGNAAAASAAAEGGQYAGYQAAYDTALAQGLAPEAAAGVAQAAASSGGNTAAITSALGGGTVATGASNAPTYLAAGTAAAGLAGAAMGADATRYAANTAADAQNNALSVADRNYQQTRSDFMPFYNVGVGAIPDYQKMLNGEYDMKESPAAQYELMKGTRAMNRALASRGLSGSGNAVQRLTELNQSIAAKDWQNQYSRILDALKLGTGASSSMGAASQSNTAANQSAAGALGNIAINQGANQASLYSGTAGTLANAAALYLKAQQAQNQPKVNYNDTTGVI
jgi:hypothetical protein